MKNNKSFINFLRKNSAYFVIGFCLLAAVLSIVIAVYAKGGKTLPEKGQGETQPQQEQTETVITFCMPVAINTGISEYSISPVYCSTLNRYSSHLGMDFFAPEGTSVLCVFDGTVEKVENTLLLGTSITVNHGNGLTTVYNSLLDGDSVVVGQKVKKGEAIGEVSITNRQEYKDGAHLHFETYENGVSVNPSKYLVFNEK